MEENISSWWNQYNTKYKFMKNIKVIISTGQGRLHLIDAASAINNNEINIKIITGWLPHKIIPNRILDFLGRIANSKNTAYGLRKRYPINIDSKYIYSCGFSEFYYQFLKILTRLNILSSDFASVIGWKMYGIQSRKAIKNAHLFHVRSGAGVGGAIEKARKEGMKIIVDHSAVHPRKYLQQMDRAQLSFKKNTISDEKFWDSVLNDCEKADVVLVSSSYVKDTFLEMGFDETKIKVANLGVNKKFSRIKKNYNINGKIKLLFTGRYSSGKGARIIEEVIARLIKLKVEFHFDIVGSISEIKDIPDWFLSNEDIVFHGHLQQEQLSTFYSHSDIYIFPTFADGSAQSLKEAMSAGMPVITTIESSAQITDQINGIIVKCGSSEDIVESIIMLQESEMLRKKLGLNAIKHIEEEFTWEKYGNKVRAIYKEIL